MERKYFMFIWIQVPSETRVFTARVSFHPFRSPHACRSMQCLINFLNESPSELDVKKMFGFGAKQCNIWETNIRDESKNRR